MEDYKRWAKNDMGISLLDDLHIRELPGDERGIFCQQPVPANSVLISIPFDSLLSSRSVRDSPLKKLADMDLREDDLLSVMLLHEVHENKEQSRWYHHLQLIPPTYHSIINYSAEELELIKGTNLYQTAHAWQTQVRGDFALLLLELRRSELDLFSVEGEGGFLWFTYENYLWALCTIWSRFVTVEMEEEAPASSPSTVLMFAPSPPKKTVVQRCMVPYFDMLNHNPTAQVSHYSDLKDKKLILYTAQSFSASDELYLNYGAASNSRLLMLYGFVIAPTIESDGEVKKVVGNPHDSVDLYAPMQPGVNSYNTKSSILSEWSVNHLSEPFKILPITGNNRNSPFSEDLVPCLRVQLANEESDLQKLETARLAPLSASSESTVAQVLRGALQNMLEQYSGGSLEDDELCLKQWGLLGSTDRDNANEVAGTGDIDPGATAFIPPNERVKNSFILCYSEKKILSDAITWIADHEDNLTPERN